jgi:parallel beta-helix repeat protein
MERRVHHWRRSVRGEGVDLMFRVRSRRAALVRVRAISVVVAAILSAAFDPHAGSAAVCDLCPLCRTYYVRACESAQPAACNDANDGTAPQRAWASLRHAADAINRHGSPGDVVIVGPGVYREGDIDLKLSGNASYPIIFLADRSGSCTGDAPGRVLVDVGGQFDTGFLVFGASHVAVSGFDITGARDAGIQVRPGSLGELSTGAVVANNVISRNGTFCTDTNPGCIRGGRGIEVMSSTDTLVFNNLVHRNAVVGISIGATDSGGSAAGSPRARLINNTVYGHDVGILVGRGTGSVSPGVWVMDNIIAGVGQVGIDVNAPSRCDYIGAFNLLAAPRSMRYSKTTPYDPSDLGVAHARFVDPDLDNFLLDAASPALDAGSAPAAALGLAGTTGRGDGTPDSGTVDLGFHADNLGIPAFSTPPIVGQVLYVRAQGHDTNDGLSPDGALRTIRQAVALARADTTIVVGPGVYDESVVIDPLHPAGPLQFSADAAGTETGDPPGRVVVDARGKADGFNLTDRCSVGVDGFAVTNAKDNGIIVKKGHRSILRNNIVFSNRSLGIQVVDSDDVQVRNNLAYANGSISQHVGGGIQIGGSVGSRRAAVENNTLYGNGVNGIQIGTAGDPSPEAVVRYNIMARNGKNGLELDNNASAGASVDGLCVEFNINADSYGSVILSHCTSCLDTQQARGPCAAPPCVPSEAGCQLRPAADLRVDPRVVRPAGSDCRLGGPYFWDDDFHLASDSPGIDFSMEDAAALGLATRTTQVDYTLDTGRVDSGFHHLPLTFADVPPLTGDCDGNRCVRVEELVHGVGIALNQAPAGSCPAFDPDQNGQVNIDELIAAVENALCCTGSPNRSARLGS